jgi:serine/threonine protein kinase
VARFRKIKKIGSGGFGEVWESLRVEDNKTFAMKLFLGGPGTDASDAERFRREVRLVTSLNHPRIVKIVATHITEPPLSFWMPLFKTNLRAVLPKYVANADMRETLLAQLLDGVAYAHSEGVIHRDLKPENILLDSSGDLAITDFGLGRRLDSDTTRKTYTGQFLGTPYYMAPEQLTDSKDADRRSDIYAIGRIFYELYTGDPPAAQQDLEKLDSGIRHLVAKATKSKPDDRFQTIDEFRRDFELVTSGTVGKRIQDDVTTFEKHSARLWRSKNHRLSRFRY